MKDSRWPNRKWKLHGGRSSNALATELHDALSSDGGTTDELKSQAALRWLGDQAEARRLQQEHTYHYVRWTFLVAFAAVIAGLITVGLALLR
jgi:hypothetical protein